MSNVRRSSRSENENEREMLDGALTMKEDEEDETGLQKIERLFTEFFNLKSDGQRSPRNDVICIV